MSFFAVQLAVVRYLARSQNLLTPCPPLPYSWQLCATLLQGFLTKLLIANDSLHTSKHCMEWFK